MNLKRYREGVEGCEPVQGLRTAAGEWSWVVYFPDPGAFQLYLRVEHEDTHICQNGPMNFLMVEPILRLGAEQVPIDVFLT